MPDIERYENLVIGSGASGKLTAWAMAKAGHRTAMVERKYLGGSCPNVACLPSKNLIYSAKVASLARRDGIRYRIAKMQTAFVRSVASTQGDQAAVGGGSDKFIACDRGWSTL